MIQHSRSLLHSVQTMVHKIDREVQTEISTDVAGGGFVAKKKKEYHCTVQVTEGFADRLTEALVELHYELKEKGMLPTPEEVEKHKNVTTV